MSDDSQAWLGTALPLDDVGSNRVELAGRFAEYVDRLVAATDRLTGTRPLAEWLDGAGRRRGRADPGRPRRPVAGRPAAARAGPGRRRGGRARRQPAAADRRPRDARRPPRRPPDPRQLPRRQPHRLHHGPDALGAAPGGLPARPRRRRLPAAAHRRRRRRAGPHAGDRRARRPLRGPPAAARRDRRRHRARWSSPTPAPTRTAARTRPPAVPLGELLDALDRTTEAPVRDRHRGRAPAAGLRPPQRRARAARHARRRSPSTRRCWPPPASPSAPRPAPPPFLARAARQPVPAPRPTTSR